MDMYRVWERLFPEVPSGHPPEAAHWGTTVFMCTMREGLFM
ncbi:unnamed protein product [Staurois parvus]|uniref:Uncharacterized protein n=1 Tax=Staurois parvus TaxID=386267 RepID=A0ABN9AS12_9NEOB|nr:unnamed protein product [Staurois parvus]